MQTIVNKLLCAPECKNHQIQYKFEQLEALVWEKIMEELGIYCKQTGLLRFISPLLSSYDYHY